MMIQTACKATAHTFLVLDKCLNLFFLPKIAARSKKMFVRITVVQDAEKITFSIPGVDPIQFFFFVF